MYVSQNQKPRKFSKVLHRFYLGEEAGFPVSFYVLVIGVFAFHRVGIYAM